MFRSFISVFLFCVLIVGATKTEPDVETLPVFTVKAHQPTADETIELANNLFGWDDYKVTLCDGRFIALSPNGTKRVEYDTVSGGIWATDESDPWSAEGPAPELPTNDEAIKMADALVEKLSLLPTEEGPVVVSSEGASSTFLAHEYDSGDGKYKREEYPLDVTVNYDIKLLVSFMGSDMKVPVVGGGGKFRVTYGNCGKLIAFQGLWRKIVWEKYYNVVPQAQLDADYVASLGYLNGTVKFNSTLAYFSAPFGNFQKTVYPVFVYNGVAQVGDETVGLRPTTSRGDSGTNPSGNAADRKKRSLHRGNALRARANQDDDRKLEAAVEWLGQPYGLKLSEQNIGGFKEEIQAATPRWNVTYERSNELVWESDFTSNDDSYVDTVDMLFYNGHANRNGWMANVPNTNAGVREWVQYSSFGTTPENPGDLLGQQDLEWLIIAACGPHQDEAFDPSAGNVFDRWRGIFDGLHIMFAYGSASYDSLEEGSRLVKYSMEGNTLIDSWFRTAKEAQPADVIVTAMWTDGPGGNARDDHLPGYGYVSEDNLAKSQERWFMWTTC